METPAITKSGDYIFYQDVNGGYLGNGRCANHSIVSTWSKDLKLISLTIDDKPAFTDEYHKNRAKFAKNRHLKWLKIYLGLEKEIKPTIKRYIYREYYDWPIQEGERELTKKGTPKFSGHNVPYTEYTKEKWAIADNYNKKLEELKVLKQKTTNQLFDK